MTPARLAGLSVLAMLAFAGNSVLTRMALSQTPIEAASFAILRVAAGAAMLAALSLTLGRGLPLRQPARWLGALTLSLYLTGFTLAYAGLDTGAGALILFGGVQITMFAGALLAGEPIPARRWAGAGLALGGLGWLLWPGGSLSLSPLHVALMGAAALGWGGYSLLGRRASDPLAATAASFVIALPLTALPLLILSDRPTGWPLPWDGAVLALISGAVTSGLGYALWYAILPPLGSARAAVAQLSVPVLAALGGAALLAEAPGWRFWGAALVVTAGVALASLPAARTRPTG